MVPNRKEPSAKLFCLLTCTSDEDQRLEIRDMHSTTSSSPGNSRDDETDEHSEDEEMVSEITTITRAADRGTSPAVEVVNRRRCSCSSRERSPIGIVLAICIMFVACLLAVVIVREKNSDKAEEGGGAADAGMVVVDVESEQPPGEGGGVEVVVEFTVANLNTNANNCTQVDYELQCVPMHNNSTNKFRIRLRPQWAPLGVMRFVRLTESGFWGGVRVFRVVPNFVSQFGISSFPHVRGDWSDATGPIADDPVVASNGRGTVAFATSGPDTRTTQIFVNTNDNWYLDGERGYLGRRHDCCILLGLDVFFRVHLIEKLARRLIFCSVVVLLSPLSRSRIFADRRSAPGGRGIRRDGGGRRVLLRIRRKAGAG